MTAMRYSKVLRSLVKVRLPDDSVVGCDMHGRLLQAALRRLRRRVTLRSRVAGGSGPQLTMEESMLVPGTTDVSRS